MSNTGLGEVVRVPAVLLKPWSRRAILRDSKRGEKAHPYRHGCVFCTCVTVSERDGQRAQARAMLTVIFASTWAPQRQQRPYHLRVAIMTAFVWPL